MTCSSLAPAAPHNQPSPKRPAAPHNRSAQHKPSPAASLCPGPQVEDRPVVKERVEMIKEHRPVSEGARHQGPVCVLTREPARLLWRHLDAHTRPPPVSVRCP